MLRNLALVVCLSGCTRSTHDLASLDLSPAAADLSQAPDLSPAWQLQASGTTQDLEGIFWDRGLVLVAVGANGTVLTSPDGTTWTSRRSGVQTTLTTGIAGGAGYIVGGGTILTSPDAITWTERPLPAGAHNSITSIAFHNGAFVAVGHNGELSDSADGGLSWSFHPTGSSDWQYGAVTNSLTADLVVVGAVMDLSAGTIRTSHDPSIDNSFLLRAAVADQRLTVAFSEPHGLVTAGLGPVIQRSSDESSWTESSPFPADAIAILIYCLDQGSYLGVRRLSAVDHLIVSADGATWTDSGEMPFLANALACQRSQLIAVGDQGAIATFAFAGP